MSHRGICIPSLRLRVQVNQLEETCWSVIRVPVFLFSYDSAQHPGGVDGQRALCGCSRVHEYAGARRIFRACSSVSKLLRHIRCLGGETLRQGLDVILEIDWQGAQSKAPIA